MKAHNPATSKQTAQSAPKPAAPQPAPQHVAGANRPQAPVRPEINGLNLIKNGSFEYWTKDTDLPSFWELKAGKVSRSAEATHKECAVRLEPVAETGTRLMLAMRSETGLKGGKLVIMMDACTGPDPAGTLIFQVQARIKGEFKGISKNPTNSEIPWVPYSRIGGGWILLSHTIELNPEMDLSDIRLTFYLLKTAKHPALIDNVAVYLCD